MKASAAGMKSSPAALHRLANGRYEILISASGAGRSSWNGLALNRWRDDPIEDDLGGLLYLRDLESGAFWSAGLQPTRVTSPSYRTWLDGERFVLEREDAGIAARLEVSVDPVLDLERRRLTLTNQSPSPRSIELTTYLEVVLFPAEADGAHPAFAKLFVQTERDPVSGALLAHRRPRGANEAWPWLVHALRLIGGGDAVGGAGLQWETDRMAFIGRGRTTASPLALTRRAPLSGTVGNVLDPVLSLRTRVHLAPGAHAELVVLTGAAAERGAALDLIQNDGAAGQWPLVGTRTGNPIPEPSADESRADPAGLRLFNGHGGFSADGREYVMLLPWRDGAPRRPPLPWINCIANPGFGLLVSESGAGYTWARNSQANRLTPWSNDPVSDPHGEALYLRDEHSGEAWSPLPGPRPAPVDYEACHGLGYSRFRCDYRGLTQEMTLFVPPGTRCASCA